MDRRTLTLDANASSITIHTRAKGMLSRLAHDLSIVARGARGQVELDDAAWSATAEVPTSSLEIEGVMKGDRVDTGALSPSDRADIRRRMLDDALSGASVVRIEARGPSRGEGDVAVTIAGPTARARVEALRARAEGEAIVAEGRCVLSLHALGAPEIKGPLGAFKVADGIEIVFRVRFA